MAVDEDVLRSARNGFLALMVAIVVAGGYQFATAGRISPAILGLWIVGAAVYYASKWRYGRDAGAGTEKG